MKGSRFYPTFTTISETPNTLCQELNEDVFDYPFFNEGVPNAGVEGHKKIRLSDIPFKKDENAMKLKGIIFHTSHCGSTLLSRMLNQLYKVRVVSEPEAINGLLLSKLFYSISDEIIDDHLEAIIDVYLQKTSPKESVIIKLTSWNVFFISAFQRLFPDVKWIYIDRDTNALMHSLEKSDGGFIDWWEHPVSTLRNHFLGKGEELENKREYLKQMIEGHRKYANLNKNELALFLKYPNFIHEIEDILNHFQLKASGLEKGKINQLLKYDAKSMKKIIWKNGDKSGEDCRQ